MSPERFDHLLTLVGPLIAKKPCRLRDPISPAERLMLTDPLLPCDRRFATISIICVSNWEGDDFKDASRNV